MKNVQFRLSKAQLGLRVCWGRLQENVIEDNSIKHVTKYVYFIKYKTITAVVISENFLLRESSSNFGTIFSLKNASNNARLIMNSIERKSITDAWVWC